MIVATGIFKEMAYNLLNSGNGTRHKELFYTGFPGCLPDGRFRLQFVGMIFTANLLGFFSIDG